MEETFLDFGALQLKIAWEMLVTVIVQGQNNFFRVYVLFNESHTYSFV